MTLLHLTLLSAATVPFILAIWAGILHWRSPLRDAEVALGEGATSGLVRTRFEARTLDLSNVLRSVADTLDPLARARFVRILLSVGPGQQVHADPDALTAMLMETMGTAIRATPGGQVLVSVRPLGTQLHILVTDDGVDADQKLRESLARGPGEVIALQGGTIAIEARPGRGTAVTLRLSLPVEAKGDLTQESETFGEPVSGSGLMTVS
jgi:signal transduction histidine kinase